MKMQFDMSSGALIDEPDLWSTQDGWQLDAHDHAGLQRSTEARLAEVEPHEPLRASIPPDLAQVELDGFLARQKNI